MAIIKISIEVAIILIIPNYPQINSGQYNSNNLNQQNNT